MLVDILRNLLVTRSRDLKELSINISQANTTHDWLVDRPQNKVRLHAANSTSHKGAAFYPAYTEMLGKIKKKIKSQLPA